MIPIERTFNPSAGLLQVDSLAGYTFSDESNAHQFIITMDTEEGSISARFLRDDQVTVYVTGDIDTHGRAVITLPSECYAVPGRFVLAIFWTLNSSVTCIYVGTTAVIRAGSEQILLPDSAALTLEQQFREIVGSFTADAGITAAFARNVGEIEGEIAQFQSTVDGILEALAAADVRALNGPNLLNKDAWWVNTGSANVVCGDAARWSKSGGAYMKSITGYKMYTTEPTQEQTAGATYVYHREASGNITEAWFVYRDADDGITTSCVTLTGNDVVSDSDGEVYNKALQYNITENSAWGNMETLFYPQGYSTQYYRQGETPKSYGYYVDEMQVGQKYTVSCWARLISGDAAWLKFGWGGTNRNAMGVPAAQSGVSDTFEITGTDWKRVSWTFVFNPSGAEYTETTEQATDSNNQTYTRVIRTYNWVKRVMIGVHRKYTAVLQLCGFRLPRGGLYGDNTVDTLTLDVQAAQQQTAALTAQGANILSSIAPVENGNTATRNYASGALVVWKNKLYKAGTAITSGATFSAAAGGNLTETTLAAELAALA